MYARDLTHIGQALDQISHQWLGDTHPRLAEAIEFEVRAGVTPAEIRRYVMRQTQRAELALRCEQAARWVAGEEND